MENKTEELFPCFFTPDFAAHVKLSRTVKFLLELVRYGGFGLFLFLFDLTFGNHRIYFYVLAVLRDLLTLKD